MKKLFCLLIVVTFTQHFLQAQKQGYVWAFGDSAGINFNTSPPSPITTGLRTRGSCVSICDTLGDLLFYANTGNDNLFISGYQRLGEVWNADNTKMNNGDSLFARAWYQEMIILPEQNNSDKYLLFSLDESSAIGLYLNEININQSINFNSVIKKNLQLHSLQMADCLGAIKHGNGRDWWLIMKPTSTNIIGNNQFYTYLITPDTIELKTIHQIGEKFGGSFIEFRWNKVGDKMALVNYDGVIELFDFDRCTGTMSNPGIIWPRNDTIPKPCFWACEFSASSRYLYVSASPDSSYLVQIDLINSPISFQLDTIWRTGYPQYTGGDLKRGPDDKIYMSNIYYNGVQFPYPYADSVYNQYNMNLSVINNPDLPGASCNFTPYSFYLGGKRNYLGLPNNPDYDLGPVVGSVCDTLSVGIKDITGNAIHYNVFPNPTQGAFRIETNVIQLETYLELYDINGRQVYTQPLTTSHFTTNVYLPSLPNGVYLLKIANKKGVMSTQRLVILK